MAKRNNAMEKDYFFGTTQGRPKIYELDLPRVVPNPSQPRKHFDGERLAELAASIERHGLLQPIAVQKMEGSEQYMIVAGERRYRAHQKLGRETIQAIIVTGDPEELALIENLQRENLKPLEEAEGLASLMEGHGYTQEQLAEVVGKSRVTVTETLRLNDLPEGIKEECRTFDIPKIMLLQVVLTEDEAERQRLWEDMKAGKIRSVRQAKERRQTASQASSSKRKREGAQARIQPMLSSGRNFVRWLSVVTDADLSENHEVYAELVRLEREIAGRLAEARQAIGEPQEKRAEGHQE